MSYLDRLRNCTSGHTVVVLDLKRAQPIIGCLSALSVRIIKNGIKQTVTKLDKIKDMVLMPLSCPNCGGLMKMHDIEKKMWAIHKTCFDCVLKKETQIKIEGKWEEYERSMMNANKNAMVEDLEAAMEEWFTQSDTFVTEQGDVESWKVS